MVQEKTQFSRQKSVAALTTITLIYCSNINLIIALLSLGLSKLSLGDLTVSSLVSVFV